LAMVDRGRRPDTYGMPIAELVPKATRRFRLHEQGERVIFWRAEVLERAGYDDGAVLLLAMREDIDLHLAVELLAKGCPPETALLILR
jgi:hypothetical protein